MYNDFGDIMRIFEEIRVKEIDSIAIIENIEGNSRKIIDRFAYAVSFCTSGQITYHHKGNDYVCRPGTVVFLPKGESYTLSCEKSGCFPIINFSCCSELKSNGFFCAELKNPEYFIHAFNELHRTFTFPGAAGQIHSLAYFYDILSHIITDLDSLGYTVLRPAVKYLSENFCSPAINNRKLAECCHISEVYFRRLFTSAYGIPPHKYISELRIQKAKELLKSNALSVTKISESCGFTSVYHFCRAFKATVGESPSKFRQKEAERF